MRPRRIRRGERRMQLFAHHSLVHASMRPRRIRRGEQEIHLRGLEEERGFNAATANSPWRTWQLSSRKAALSMLQCGHGEFAVENGDQAAIYDTQFPQRFNAATANSPWRTTLAETRLGAPRSLQCGHGEFAVENSAPRPAGHCARTASMRPRRIRRGERQAGAGAGDAGRD